MRRAKTPGMSITPPDYARWLAEPSIVIDPALLAPPAAQRPSLGRRLARVTFTTLRTVACAGIVGVTLFSVAHADKWLARGHNSAHAAESSQLFAAADNTRGTQLGESQPAFQQASVAIDAQRADSAVPAALAVVAAEEPQVAAADAVAAKPAVSEEIEEPSDELGPAVVIEANLADAELREALRSGRRALNQNRLSDSEAAYGSVLVERPHHPGALAGLSRVALARGDLDGAYKLAQQAMHAAPSHAVYHVTLAHVLRARGETAGADLEYEAAARLSRKPLDRAAKMLPANPF